VSMATLLRQLRDRRRLTQTAALALLDRRAQTLGEDGFALSIEQFARLEKGRVKTVSHPATRRVLEAEYGRPFADLIAVGGEDPGEPDTPLTASLATPAEHIDAIIGHLAQLDHEQGPQAALRPSVALYESIRETARKAPSTRERERFLRLAARCAELIGWLYQDSLRLREARDWTARALDLAEAVEACEMITYILMRRSSIAVEFNQPEDALMLAERALRRSHTSSDMALALREIAAAHALNRNEAGFREAAERAIEYADGQPRTAITTYCSIPYLRSEAGMAALILGDPGLAVDYLEPAAHRWPQGQPRDRAVCVARLALAHARAGELDEAEQVAVEAVGAGTRAFSSRFDATLRSVFQILPAPDRAELSEYRREVERASLL
jgi:transcriptional regulator with XRE-family HTH domain